MAAVGTLARAMEDRTVDAVGSRAAGKAERGGMQSRSPEGDRGVRPRAAQRAGGSLRTVHIGDIGDDAFLEMDTWCLRPSPGARSPWMRTG